MAFKNYYKKNRSKTFFRPIALVDEEDSKKIPKNVWFHGDTHKRQNFCDQKMDREAFVQDPNANGPGIYFTKDYTQARGYANPNGYVYTVKIDIGHNRVILEDDEAEDHKEFLFFLIKKAQEYDPEHVYYAVTDYGVEIMDVDDVTDEHIKDIIEEYLSNLKLIGAAVSIYKEFFGREANEWTKAMKDLGVVGFIQEQPETTHFIVYDCDAITILKEEKYVQEIDENKTFKSFISSNNKKEILNEKFQTSDSITCAYCGSKAKFIDVKQNKNHHFLVGQHFKCDCGKTQVWTNSIRNVPSLIRFIRGESNHYMEGFCDDLYCAHTYLRIRPAEEVEGDIGKYFIWERLDNKSGSVSVEGYPDLRFAVDYRQEYKEANSDKLIEDYLNFYGGDIEKMAIDIASKDEIEMPNKKEGDKKHISESEKLQQSVMKNTEFINWFGDSKAVDNNGNPMVMFHGTRSDKHFTVFSVEGVQHFSDDDADEEFEKDIDEGSGAEPNAFLGAHFAQEPHVASKFAIADNDWLKMRYQGRKTTGGGRVFPVFLKIENPMVFKRESDMDDFIYSQDVDSDYVEHALWDKLEDVGEDEYDDLVDKYEKDEDFRQEVNPYAMALTYHMEDPDGNINHAVEFARELAVEAKEQLIKQGYDGVKYKNDVEGGISWIAFYPNQIKSAIGSSFTDDPDILKDSVENVEPKVSFK